MLAGVDSDLATLLQIVSLVMTTLGAGWALYIGYKQKQIDMKLELAKLAAEQAKSEAEKQGRRMNKKARQLNAKQDEQTRKIDAIQKQTNGMQEQIVKSAHEEGIRQGAEAEKARIAEVATEVAKGIHEKISPPMEQR